MVFILSAMGRHRAGFLRGEMYSDMTFRKVILALNVARAVKEAETPVGRLVH